jgi:hypothetical protein
MVPMKTEMLERPREVSLPGLKALAPVAALAVLYILSALLLRPFVDLPWGDA